MFLGGGGGAQCAPPPWVLEPKKAWLGEGKGSSEQSAPRIHSFFSGFGAELFQEDIDCYTEQRYTSENGVNRARTKMSISFSSHRADFRQFEEPVARENFQKPSTLKSWKIVFFQGENPVKTAAAVKKGW